MKFFILLVLFYGTLAVPVEDEALQEFVNGNHIFTASVYKELLKSQSGNLIVSPISLETVLALTNEGARTETSEELVTGLSLPSSKEKIQRAFKTFLPKLKKSDDGLKLLSANKIYAGKSVQLENDFKSVAANVYNSGVENVEFEKNKEAVSTINNWVEENTDRKIKNLLKEDDVDSKTKLVLVNVLYFSGKWIHTFRDFATAKKAFFKTKAESVDVDTMRQTQYFNYYENPEVNAKFLELPYEGGDVSMVIVLPNEKDGLGALEQNLGELLAPVPFIRERVNVEIPKFTIESEIRFIPILEKLGVKKLFRNDADLTGLSSTDKNLYVSQVVQKAFINVTEAGTEAAAATAVVATAKSGHAFKFDPVIFHADHPFLYLIKSNDVVLFVGRYTSP